MPIYEYKCEHCGEQFEVLQKVNDDPLTECVACSRGPVKKLISASAFVLKGAGFYVNDYPSESRKRGMENEKGKSEKGSGSASTAASSTRKPKADTSASTTA